MGKIHHDLNITAGGFAETAIEPAEKFPKQPFFILFRFKQDYAERRGEGERKQRRNENGRDEGQSELLVHDPGCASKEGYRDEHGTQHQRDGEDGPCDFMHGVPGSLERGKPF